MSLLVILEMLFVGRAISLYFLSYGTLFSLPNVIFPTLSGDACDSCEARRKPSLAFIDDYAEFYLCAARRIFAGMGFEAPPLFEILSKRDSLFLTALEVFLLVMEFF